MSGLPFSKLCEFEDFADPELASVIRDVCAYKIAHFPPGYPAGSEHRKDWEVAMAVRALDHFGALHPDATLLCVGAGTEDTIFYLTRRARQVFAVDRYLEPGDWLTVAPPLMLVDPSSIAPFAFDPDRLVVQHMDGRSLRYPDETFDGIFSSGSIEHFGDLDDIAAAAYEMGRVLKPGGVLSLSTEFRLSGTPGGLGWPGLTLLFSKENLERYIVDATGLTTVNDLDTSVSDATLAAPVDLPRALAGHAAAVEAESATPDPRPEYALWDFPQLVQVQGGYVFGSVHLTLRKTERYLEKPNAWAKPSPALLAEIADHNRRAAQSRVHPAPAAPAAEPAARPAAHHEPPPRPAGGRSRAERVQAVFNDLDNGRDEVDQRLAEVDRVEDTLRHRRAQGDVAAEQPAQEPGWVTRWVHAGENIGFTVVLEPEATDPISSILSADRILDQPGVRLMLQTVAPGERVLDLGAHVGMFSLAAAAVGCHVLAVEASPTNAALLRSAAARNGFHNLHVINAAVMDAPGTVEFVAHGPWGHVAWEGGRNDTVRVPGVTVDHLLAEAGWDTAHFVKMDVEGSELRALAAMNHLLGRPDSPPVVFESNGHILHEAGVAPEELFARFEALGYATYLMDLERLTRFGPGDFQAETVSECLAAKRRPRGLDGWIVLPRQTRDDLVARIVGESRHDNLHCRAYLARALGSAGITVLSDPAVVEVLEALRGDPAPEVQAALAWSSRDARSEWAPAGVARP